MKEQINKLHRKAKSIMNLIKKKETEIKKKVINESNYESFHAVYIELSDKIEALLYVTSIIFFIKNNKRTEQLYIQTKAANTILQVARFHVDVLPAFNSQENGASFFVSFHRIVIFSIVDLFSAWENFENDLEKND